LGQVGGLLTLPMGGSSTPGAGTDEADAVGVEAAARRLLDAESACSPQPPLTDEWPDLDVETAYAIQDRALELRLERGEILIGLKVGLTSLAKQQQMGVDSPITGWLTDAMRLAPGAHPPLDRLIHPRAEPEVAFVMGQRLVGPGVTADIALSAVRHVYAGVEVLDSRFEGFNFRLPDVVADNASSSLFALGGIGRSPASLDLAQEACLLEADGMRQSAAGSAILGHPAEALALAANELARRGRAIEPRWIVLTGGLTDAVPIARETAVHVSFTNLGTLVLGGAR
jgi:2-oxo-3-hexenedioate decarboxylase